MESGHEAKTVDDGMGGNSGHGRARKLRGSVSTLALLAACVATHGFASPAMAAEKIKLELGGFMEQWFGYADNDNITPGTAGAAGGRSYHHLDQQSDTEIYVDGSTDLDNGLTVGVHVEIEGETANGVGIDVSNLYVESGTAGRLELGGAENVAWTRHKASPDVGIKNQDGDVQLWLLPPGAFTNQFQSGWNPAFGTANKINYITPSLGGFSAAATYTPDQSSGTNAVPNSTAQTNNNRAGSMYAFSLAFDGEVGPVTLGIEGAYGRLGNNVTNSTLQPAMVGWQGGINMAFEGITLGGGFIHYDDRSTLVAGQTASNDGYVFDVGGSYTTGPYSVSLTWLRSVQEGLLTNTNNDVKDQVMLSGAYNLGAGIDFKTSLFYADYDDETTVAANNNEGWGLVGGLQLTF